MAVANELMALMMFVWLVPEANVNCCTPSFPVTSTVIDPSSEPLEGERLV